jgi:hypothetical protein
MCSLYWKKIEINLTKLLSNVNMFKFSKKRPTKRVTPVVTKDMPFGWGYGEPPTPEDEELELNHKNIGVEESKESKDKIVFLGICHNMPDNKGNPSAPKR